MTVDEAIKYLRNPLSWAIGKTLEKQIADNKEATQMAIDALEKQRWIPCSERLPETDEFVLVSLSGRYKNIRFEHSCEIADYADGEWFINAYPFMMAEIANHLIEAWMPLPELYKGETT